VAGVGVDVEPGVGVELVVGVVHVVDVAGVVLDVDAAGVVLDVDVAGVVLVVDVAGVVVVLVVVNVGDDAAAVEFVESITYTTIVRLLAPPGCDSGVCKLAADNCVRSYSARVMGGVTVRFENVAPSAAGVWWCRNERRSVAKNTTVTIESSAPAIAPKRTVLDSKKASRRVAGEADLAAGLFRFRPGAGGRVLAGIRNGHQRAPRPASQRG
jgi:hypothetical protein